MGEFRFSRTFCDLVPEYSLIMRRIAKSGFGAFSLAMALIGMGLAPNGVPTAKKGHLSLRPMISDRRTSPLGSSAPPTMAWCQANWQVSCFQPAQLQTAYDLEPLTQRSIQGQGQTIAVIDPFGSPTINSDLTKFDATFGIPDPPKISVISPVGKVPPFNPRNATMVGWAGETTLDVEWAHAMAPRASILVVTTPTDESEGTAGFPDIVAAEKFVIKNSLATVISQSFGATEPTFPSLKSVNGLRGAFTAAQSAGVTVIASTGDSGATDVGLDGTTYFARPSVDWPASDPLVTAVGGTTLHLDAAGNRTSADTVWNDSSNPSVVGSQPSPNAGGGGRSMYFSRPSFQDAVWSVTGTSRGIPDISMSAACSALVDVYQGYQSGSSGPGWYEVCGTSEAAPVFAGIVALADQVAGHGLGTINARLYRLATQPNNGIVDVTSGNNTVSFSGPGGARTTVTGYGAGQGYDLASGLGTLDAALFVPALAAAKP